MDMKKHFCADGSAYPEEDADVVDDPRELAYDDSHFVTLHGVLIHYRTTIVNSPMVPKSAVLFLIHGFSGSSMNWSGVWAELSEHFHLVALDLPGWGLSQRVVRSGTRHDGEWPVESGENPYTYPFQVAIIEGLLNSLHLDKSLNLIMLGHSYGGTVAAYCMSHYQRLRDRFTGLILVSAPLLHWPVPRAIAKLAKLAPSALARIPAKLYGASTMSSTLFQLPFHDLKKFINKNPQGLKDWDITTRVAHWSYALAEWMRVNASPADLDLKAIQDSDLPVLDIHGVFDRIIQQEDEKAASSYFTEYCSASESGHFPFAENKDEFIFSVTEFIEVTIGANSPEIISKRVGLPLLKSEGALRISFKLYLVLGAPTNAEGWPGPDLMERLQTALKVVASDDSGILVVTGGSPTTYGSSGVVSEAEASRRWLERQGFKGQLILEDGARHTFDNFTLTRKEVLRRGILKSITAIIIITHDWHMERAYKIAVEVFKNDQSIEIRQHPVVTDHNEQQVKRRIAHERKLCDQWLPREIKRFRTTDKMKALEEEQRKPDQAEERIIEKQFEESILQL